MLDPDQTAPVGAVWSWSTIFASMLMLNRHFSDADILLAFSGLNSVCCVYTEIMAQDDTVTFELNHASFSAFTYV